MRKKEKKWRKRKMARYIRMTDELKERARQEFDEFLSASDKMLDGKISFSKKFDVTGKKTTVYLSEEAWCKMQALVNGFSNEVAWHGVAARVESDDVDGYIISDIVVYPQSVTGATVDMDEEGYAMWIIQNDGDERFNQLWMQGHSHVNMATAPSPTDIKHQSDILDQLGDEDFYIFMILNKSGSRWATIFDMKKNVMYENDDITVSVVGWSSGIDEFMKEARSLVKTKVYQTKPYASQSPYRPMTTTSGAGSNVVNVDSAKPKTQIGSGWAGRDGNYNWRD